MEPAAHLAERARHSALVSARVLDTPPEERFDRITRLAARLLEAPFSLLSFVDADRVWYKSCYGTERRELASHLSVCAHAIHTGGFFAVEDLRAHRAFSGLPYVAGEPHLRFYAGAPVRSACGQVLGMLCVADTRPRMLSAEDRAALEDLAEMAALELERRRQPSDEVPERNRLLNMVAEGRPLQETLAALCHAVEAASEGTRAAVLLIDQDGSTLRSGAAPSLPDGYLRALDGIRLPSAFGSWTPDQPGSAGSLMDGGLNPFTEACRTALRPYGPPACQSAPIYASDGALIGVLALHPPDHPAMDEEQQGLILRLAQIAGIAIERHRDTLRFREKDEAFRLLAENAQDVIVRLRPDLSFIYASPSVERLLGYKPSELPGKSLPGLIHPGDLSAVASARRAVLGGEPATITARLANRDGHYVWVEATATPLVCDGSGSAAEIHVVARDISDRKRAEAEAEQANARFRTLVEQSITGIYIVRDGRFAYVNPRFAQMTGYTAEELLALPSIAAVIHPEDRATVAEHIRRRFSGEEVEASYGLRGLRKGGEVVYIELHGTVIEHEGRQALLGTVLDVTERTLAEQALRASREQYRAVVEDVQDVIFEADMAGRWSFLSPAWERITGVPTREALGQSALALLHPDHHGESRASFTAVMRGEAERCDQQLRLVLPGGERWVEVYAVPFRGPDGRPHGVRGTIRDVHERVEARLERARLTAQLEAERSRLQYVFRHGPAGICTLRGPDHVFEMANENYLQFVGRRDVIGKPVREALPEVAEQGLIELLDRVLETGEPFYGTEVPIYLQQTPGAAPELRYANFVYGPLREADGSISGVFTHGVDVTDHVLARERLVQTSRANALIMDHSPDVICTMDREGRFVQVSAASEKVWGYAPGELEGQPYARFVHPEDAEKTRAAVGEALAGRGYTSFENRYLRKDGAAVIMMWSAVWSEADGLMFCVARNVSGLREAEAARRQSKERLRLATEAADVGVFDTDLVTGLRRWSDRAKAHFGVPAEQPVTDALFAERVHPEDLDRLDRAQAEAMDPRGDGRFHMEHRIRRPDGEVRWVAASGEVAFAGNGPSRRPVRLIGTLMDVTERRRIEEELVRAKERAEEMAALKSSFLANMSHEIRTPLAGIIGFSEILAEEVVGESREFADLISSSGKRLLDTLNSVLDLAQLESGSMPLRLEPVDAASEIRNVIGMLTPQASGKGLRLRFEEPEPLPAILADRPALGRVLSNLLSNAVKFTHTGGVTVRAWSAGDLVRISVADTGVGIGPAFLPHVFDEFRQESSGTARSFEGSGLGLTITRRLVGLMGGEIALESEKGRGTTFTVTLKGAGAPAPASEIEPGTESRAPGKPLLLAVEDTPDTQKLLRHILSPSFEVDLAASAEEALEMARRHRYAAFVIDINLGSDRDGVELLRALRRMPEYAGALAVACTAYAMPGDEQHFRSSGFDAYVSKPFKRQDLLRALQAAQDPPGERT